MDDLTDRVASLIAERRDTVKRAGGEWTRTDWAWRYDWRVRAEIVALDLAWLAVNPTPDERHIPNARLADTIRRTWTLPHSA